MSFPTPSQLTMQAAVALACNELGISEADHSKRECGAIHMAPLMKGGPLSIERLKSFAVSQYRMSVGAKPDVNVAAADRVRQSMISEVGEGVAIDDEERPSHALTGSKARWSD